MMYIISSEQCCCVLTFLYLKNVNIDYLKNNVLLVIPLYDIVFDQFVLPVHVICCKINKYLSIYFTTLLAAVSLMFYFHL